MSKLKLYGETIALALILLVLFLTNYRLGTYLIGWDNLMPELNIFMNIKRSLTAVWQQYQGLGLVGGMAHSTDLIRQLIILPFTLLLPNSLIRYLWHFSMLGLGTFGIYFGLKNKFKFNRLVCLTSSLFYLLNFGTLQNFYVPFEPFSTFWGFFPWLIFSFWYYLDHPNKKNLKKLILFNILAIPSFYVQTIFIVYLLSITAIAIPYLKTKLKTSFKSFLLILSLNAFWLLPLAYFLKNDLANTKLGIGNLLSSQETFSRNQFRGTIFDFLLMRGYYYDLPFGTSNLMSFWRDHFSKLYVLITGYLLSIISLFGILKTKKKGLFILFSICGLALLSATPPFSYLNSSIRQISILDQVFRSPFTKFIVPTIFCFTIFLAQSLQFFKSKIFNFTIILAIFIISIPSFTGKFIYPDLKQKIPQEYFQLFDYFKTQPKNARIANLPSGNFWGWTNYRQGISGSGFLWYGIEQPILDRAFDVWSLKNEQYYWELNYALQKQDQKLLENIIDKYNISYLIFDNNLTFLDQPIYGKQAILTRDLLGQMRNLSLEANFGQITVYKTSRSPNPYIINNPQNISQSGFLYQDIAYQEYGDYISSKNPNITYPYANLFTNRLQVENKFPIENLLYPDKKPYVVYTPTQEDITLNKNDTNSQEIINENDILFLRLKSKSTNNLFAKYFADLSLNDSYLVKITYRHISNYPLLISAFSEPSRLIYFNTKLEKTKDWTTAWFVLPKLKDDPFNPGLTILFNNTTFDKISSINDIKDISIYPFPFEQLIKTKINVSSDITPTSIYVIPQSYHSGWISIPPRPHVLVNNWANGFLVKDNEKIIVIFWPQILEYLGFILAFGVILTQIHCSYSVYRKKRNI